MTSLPDIKNQLREHLSELYEACFAEQEWLEEGRLFEASEQTRFVAGKSDSIGFTEEKSADAA